MPYYYFYEVWTPLKLVGIRFYKDDNGNAWVKIWNQHKRKIGIATKRRQ